MLIKFKDDDERVREPVLVAEVIERVELAQASGCEIDYDFLKSFKQYMVETGGYTLKQEWKLKLVEEAIAIEKNRELENQDFFGETL